MTDEQIREVLEMPEDEQRNWLKRYSQGRTFFADHWQDYLCGHISLADLAFRLRDEATRQGWDFQVLLNKVRIAGEEGYDGDGLREGAFWICHISKPIHWILAAIQAKGMSK